MINQNLRHRHAIILIMCKQCKKDSLEAMSNLEACEGHIFRAPLWYCLIETYATIQQVI